MDFLHILGHTLTHALTDTLRALPFLFLAYLLLEWIPWTPRANSR